VTAQNRQEKSLGLKLAPRVDGKIYTTKIWSCQPTSVKKYDIFPFARSTLAWQRPLPDCSTILRHPPHDVHSRPIPHSIRTRSSRARR